MKIFHKRPLSLILCIMLGAFVFFSLHEQTSIRIIGISVLLILLITTFMIPIISKNKFRFVRVCTICAIISMLFSFIYFDLWFKAYDRYDGEVKIVGTVEEIEKHSYTTEILIKTNDIDSTVFSTYKLTAHIDHELYYGYSAGSMIEFYGVIEDFSSSDANSYNFSRGISGTVYEVTDFKILDIGEPTFSNKLSSFRHKICRRLINSSNADVGGLLAALLLGEKSYLPTGTALDFSRIGISHILALSGMHLAILAIGFSRLLAFFRVGKKPATVITILFAVIYMAVTGFSVSVVRAGIMLITSSMLYLLAFPKDSMTSLFISVSSICLCEPYSIFDLSLWLSAFATLGIIVMSEYQSRNYKKPSFLRWIFTAMLSTVFAISATFFITISSFDGISLLSPISTLVFSILVEAFLYVGLLLIALGSFFPIKFLISAIGYAIIELARFLSGLDFIYVSTEFLLIKILAIVFSFAFFCFLLLNIRKKTAYISFLACFLAFIFVLSASLTYLNQDKTDILYLNKANEQILIKDQHDICAVDIATYDKKTAYGAYNVFVDNRITYLDKYVVTHYSYTLEESISTLTSSILIKEILLPLPKNSTEERIFLSICESVPQKRTKITLYKSEDIIFIGEIALIPIYRGELGKEKQLLFTLLYSDDFYTYLNVDMLDGKTKNMALEVIDGSRAIIFGRHETGTEECKFTYKLSEPEVLVFSSNRIKIHRDTLEYYSNCDIYFEAETVSLIR